MKKININYIPQNIAPIGAKKLALFNSKNEQVAEFSLRNLASKSLGEKLYSFGALSDVHLPYAAQNASTDFQKALTYFNNVANVNFICISGDMSDGGTDAEWLDYKNHVDAYSPNIPVHLSAGNHDVANGDMLYDYPVQYTGNPLWYSFEQNNDVFIMFGLRQWQGDNVFHNEALQWLYETLEENKDKRCFVFQHEMRLDGCGNAHGLYGWDGLAGRNGKVFLSLMEHYKNVIWFHGHSHTPFRLQSVQPTPIANYDRLHGCHSVHIPSLAIPRYGNSDVIFDAEGYVVDVYENGIHLRGIDFIEEEFVPIASYWIDTTPVEIPENSYVDTKGVIKKKAISLPEGSELIMNQRYSYSGNGLVTDTTTPPMFTAIIPAMPSTGYVLKIKNSNIDFTTASGSVVYGIDSSKSPAQYINGGNIPSMTTGITYSEDKKSADITFTTNNNVSYIALSLRALSSGTLKESDIVDYIVELEQSGNNNDQPEITIPEGSELYINKRYSYSEAQLVDENGMFTVFIPLDEHEGTPSGIRIKNSSIPLNVKPGAGSNHVVYMLKPDKTNLGKVLGGIIPDMSSDIITYSADYKSVDIPYNMPSDCGYLVISLRVLNSLTAINVNNIKDYIIEIYNQPTEIPEEVLNYTNLVPTSIDVDETIYNSVGYKDNTYITTDGSVPIDTTKELVTTGLIEIPENIILYVYGATFNTVNSYCRVVGYNESKECVNIWAGGGTSINVIDVGNGIQRIEIVSSTLMNCHYIRFTFEGIGANLHVYNIADETILPKGDITNSVTWTMDKRLSSAGDPDKDLAGAMASDYISVIPGDVISIYGISSLDDRAFYINFYKNETFIYNIPLSNANMNPTDHAYAYVEYNAETLHLTIQTRKGGAFNRIRVCCVASTVSVYRNAEKENEGNEELDPLVLPEGSELYLNQRFSQSGQGLTASQGQFAVFIPIDGTKEYTLSISNMPVGKLNETDVTLYKLDETKTVGTQFNGANHPGQMTTGVTMSEDYKSAVINVPAGNATVHYLAFTFPVNINLQLTEQDLAGIVITLEESN